MKWQVTRTTDSVHVSILIAASPGYTRAVLLAAYWFLPQKCSPDIPVGENPAMTQTFGNQFFSVYGNYLQLIS